MTIDRRNLLAGGVAGLAATTAAWRPAAAKKATVSAYVCSYTSHAAPGNTGNGQGITEVQVDAASGTLRPLRVTEGPSPSWLCFDAAGRHAYAVNEIADFKDSQGSVTSYRVEDRGLRRLNVVASGGNAPVVARVHPQGQHLLVANYGDGKLAVLPIASDGSLATASDVVAPAGRAGPAAASAAVPGSFAISGHDGSHAHMIDVDPSGSFILSTDLGFDRINVWSFDSSAGRLRPAPHPFIEASSPGAGPRHFAFHPSGRLLFVIFEESSQVASYRFDPGSGALELVTVRSTLPPGYTGTSFASGLVIDRQGQHLYCANRLHNSISTFRVGASGSLHFVANDWVRGDYPNHLALDPSGRLLLASNRRSDQVTGFHVEPQTGQLRFTDRYTAVGSPNMVAFRG